MFPKFSKNGLKRIRSQVLPTPKYIACNETYGLFVTDDLLKTMGLSEDHPSYLEIEEDLEDIMGEVVPVKILGFFPGDSTIQVEALDDPLYSGKEISFDQMTAEPWVVHAYDLVDF